MATLKRAGVGERRARDFAIYVIDADGNKTVATLTGIQVYLYKKTKAAVDWSAAVSKNTTDDPGELDLVDYVDDDGVTHTDGAIRLTPPESWWSAAGDFQLTTEIMTTPPYFAPDTAVHDITVVSRP